MRKAAAGWEDEYARRIEGEGFVRGIGAPTVFHNPQTGVRLVVHGDDVTFSGTRKELERMMRKMEEWYEIKDRGMMGSATDEAKEVVILGRRLRWTVEGQEYEADEKHVEELMKGEGLKKDSRAAVGPAMKEKQSEDGWELRELERYEAKEFRAKAARMNYLGHDRADLQYATKERGRVLRSGDWQC